MLDLETLSRILLILNVRKKKGRNILISRLVWVVHLVANVDVVCEANRPSMSTSTSRFFDFERFHGRFKIGEVAPDSFSEGTLMLVDMWAAVARYIRRTQSA